ncbi:MAG: hypothetical protein LBK43_00895 [Treponema sp.]|jgi:transcription antitermination factor NusG|nr:hypothetical protein [Treponema sp.]
MLNLASSFRLRNKIKEKISTISAAIEDAEFSKTVGTQENTSPCDGKTLERAISEVGVLMDILQELNLRIAEANQVNRETLITLETLKARIVFYEKITKQCRRCKQYELEQSEEGDLLKVAKEPLVDQGKMTAVIAALKKEKDALEEKIATVNFNTPVDFDPEHILSRI